MKQTQYQLNIAYLYPKSMNIYGDRGNIIALTQRCQWRGIHTQVDKIEVGDTFDSSKYDLVFSGGGQDVHQLRIADDLTQKKVEIQKAVDRGVVFLLICGSYQLFGHYFLTSENIKIPGISILDAFTAASKIAVGTQVRMIGNIVTQVNFPDFKSSLKTLVGFENHSGMTFVGYDPDAFPQKIQQPSTTQALANVIIGSGNNGDDSTEGARYKNVFGTYLHGSLLPKNPHFADYLIKIALQSKYNRIIKLKSLDNITEYKAHRFILTRKKK